MSLWTSRWSKGAMQYNVLKQQLPQKRCAQWLQRVARSRHDTSGPAVGSQQRVSERPAAPKSKELVFRCEASEAIPKSNKQRLVVDMISWYV